MRRNVLKYDYSETKDLLKSFITLISATLVLSLTFSEKVVRIGTAAPGAESAMLTAWVAFIVALIIAGVALCFIAAAAGKILYGDIPIFNLDYWSLALTGWACGILSGCAYVGGLIALVVAASKGLRHAAGA